MKIGDTVKFLDGLYFDEKCNRYQLLEMNGDNALIELICDDLDPERSVVKLSELIEVFQNHDLKDKKKKKTLEINVKPIGENFNSRSSVKPDYILNNPL
jgi:hypothetical protein